MATNLRKILEALKADGLNLDNQKGSHAHFVHPTKQGTVSVPIHRNVDIKRKTVNSILRQAGLK